MALAFLEKTKLQPGQELLAFVVDHKLRPNSTDESLLVKANLEKLGSVD